MSQQSGQRTSQREGLPEVDRIVEVFEFFDDWEQRYQFLIDLGAKLPPFPASAQREENRVAGCMSKVWIVAHPDADDPRRLRFHGDSDTSTVKGLVALLVTLYSGRSAEDVLATDADAFFERLGLFDHLSPTRHVGVYAMVEKIRALAGPHAGDAGGDGAMPAAGERAGPGRSAALSR
ncbi:MAG: SufE family protein [Burkholderiales bacterium]|nr:SufE family protein [Burkholderiales bacterium]